ncbi:MAG TPA: hypothetical protein VN638_10045 [Nitrospiraceae bacterium]|nr:hypothetical protein [Nitrospiraceae bacterium]
MIVRFFELTREGTATVGDIRLEDGVLIADPADRRALVRLISEPFRLWHPQKGDQGFIMPVDHPVEFLQACVNEIRGTYFWCQAVEADGVEKKTTIKTRRSVAQ